MTVAQPSTVDTLGEYADEVLGVAELALATTDAGTPDRSYVTAWTPALDCCPALICQVLPLREAPTSPLSPAEETALRTKFGSVVLATYVIWAIRCAAEPFGNEGLPRVEDITVVAHQVMQDGWALWNGIRKAQQTGNLFDGCLGMHMDGAVSIPEQGGCVGVTLTLRASIAGIP